MPSIVKLPPLAVTSTVTTGGAAPASEPTAPTVTVALPTPVAEEGPPASVAEHTLEPPPTASEPAAEPAPGPTPGAANSTEETDTPP